VVVASVVAASGVVPSVVVTVVVVCTAVVGPGFVEVTVVTENIQSIRSCKGLTISCNTCI
jgi:hypothetical protein